MAGLSFKTGLTASSGPGTQQAATTAGEAAYGPGYSSAPKTGLSALFSSTPAAWTVWLGAGAVGGLYLLRRSLPGEKKWAFDLVVMAMLLGAPVKGVAKMSLQRIGQDAKQQGLVDDLARAGIWILS